MASGNSQLAKILLLTMCIAVPPSPLPPIQKETYALVKIKVSQEVMLW